MKREVVHRDGRGLRMSDDIYKSSKTEVERPSDRAPIADRSGHPSGGETKLSCLCGLPFCTGCPPHIPPRYRYLRSTLIQQFLRI